MSVESILSEMAANAGLGARRKGAIYGDLVAGAAQVPAQILADRERLRVQRLQEARQAEQLGFQRHADARATSDQTLQEQAGQRELTKTQQAEQERQDRAAIMTAGLDTTGPTPAFKFEPAVAEAMKRGRTSIAKELIDAHETTAQKNAPKTQAELAADAANPHSPTQAQSSTALDLMRPPKEAPKPPDVGSFTDYVQRGAAALGKPTSQLTPKDIEQFRKAYQQADDRPRITVNTGPNAPPPPGDFAKTGEDFLATIPAQWRATVKKIAAYDEDPTKVASMRGGNREMLTQWVNQVNPAYKADEFTNRAPTRKAFTTGVQGQQINAINTAIGHIDQLTALADDLQNGGFVPANKAANVVKTMFGGASVTNFDTLKDALAGEVSSVLSKGGATVSGIAEAKEKIHGANSPAQLAGYVKTLIPVMGSKLASLDYQFHQAMGADDPFSALSPDVKRILTKHGFDPAHPTVQGDSGAIKVGGFTVVVK